MVTSPAALPRADQPETQAPSAVGRKRQRWFELFLVLFVSLGSSVYNAVHILHYGVTPEMQRTSAKWIMGTAHETVMLLLLTYVLSRTGRKLKDIGLRWSLRDIGAGVLLCATSYAAYIAGAILLGFISWTSGPLHRGAKELFGGFSAFAIPFTLLNPFFEELIVRAYLMTEIRALTGSAALAVLASAVFQTSYHLYYGWWTALSMGLSFLVLSIYYAGWHRALPLIVAHEILDLVALFHP